MESYLNYKNGGQNELISNFREKWELCLDPNRLLTCKCLQKGVWIWVCEATGAGDATKEAPAYFDTNCWSKGGGKYTHLTTHDEDKAMEL